MAQEKRLWNFTKGYDPNGNRTSVTWPDGYRIDYENDALNRVTTVEEHVDDVNDITLATYSYDVLSRRTGIAYGNGATVSYGYDADNDNDLVAISHFFTGAANDNVAFSYAYTRAGQLSSEGLTNAAFLWQDATEAVFTYAANTLNQYTNVTQTPALGDAVARSLAYDLDGNLTSDGLNSYTYDGENRLTAAAMNDPSHWWQGNVAYDYDAFGRREARHTTQTGSTDTFTTRFLADGDYDIATYADDGGGVLELQHRYIYGPGVDEPIAVVEVDHDTVAGTYTQVSIAFGRKLIHWINFLSASLPSGPAGECCGPLGPNRGSGGQPYLWPFGCAGPIIDGGYQHAGDPAHDQLNLGTASTFVGAGFSARQINRTGAPYGFTPYIPCKVSV